MERRYTAPRTQPVRVETRADGTRTIQGHAAVYYRDGDPGTEFKLMDDLVERIEPGAFNRALTDADDVRALFNHDINQILGRTTAGTLRLNADDIGLRYEIDVPTTPQAEHVVSAIDRGDLTGSSFAFMVEDEEFIDTGEDQPDIRSISSVKLFDVGPVTFPAYESTSTALRAGISDLEQRLDQWRQGLEQPQISPRLSRARLKIAARV